MRNKPNVVWPIGTLGMGTLRHSGITALALLLSVLAVNVDAENGRDYSATYDIGPATSIDANRVSTKLSLQLQNHSGAFLTNATISLGDRSMPAKAGEPLISGVTVAYRSVIKVSSTVVIRKDEYRRWQHGVPPFLTIALRAPGGQLVNRPIELARMPALGAAP